MNVQFKIALLLLFAMLNKESFSQTEKKTLISKKNSAMKVSQTKTIVFITGAFVTNNCWDEWIPYFE